MPLDACLSSECTEIACDTSAWQLTDVFEVLVDRYSTAVNDRDEKCPVDWFTHELRNMRETLMALRVVCESTGDEQAWSSFRHYRGLYRAKIEQTKREAYTSYIASSSNKLRGSWNIINYERGSSKSRKNDHQITPNDFNIYFSSIGDQIQDSIPVHGEEPVTLMGGLEVPSNSFFMLPISEDEVLSAVTRLKNGNVVDCFGITSNLVKTVVNFIVAPLTALYNMCINVGHFPSSFKTSRVIPVYKKGDKNLASNYRPISITVLFGKIFEMILKSRLEQFFEVNNLFSSSQFGFRPSRSTTDAVLEVSNFIVENFDIKVAPAAIFLDLQRAFDSVSHEVLLEKLFFYGVRGLTLKLLTSYLSDRYQYVDIDGQISSQLPVIHGVPQGSVLGPLLFVIFINDFPNYMLPSRVVLYADDATLLVAGHTQFHLERTISATVEKANLWFEVNKLKINSTKTNVLRFTSAQNSPNTESVTLLGIILDGSLRWHKHVERLSERISRNIFVLRRMVNCLDPGYVINVYYALIHSLLSYGVIMWGRSTHAERVFLLQKQAIRVLDRLPPLSSCRDAFARYGILTLPSLYILDSLLRIHARASEFQRHSDVHSYDTRTSDRLLALRSRIQLTATNKLDLDLYNILPTQIKSLSYNLFKRTIRQFLSKNSIYSISEFKTLVTNSPGAFTDCV